MSTHRLRPLLPRCSGAGATAIPAALALVIAGSIAARAETSAAVTGTAATQEAPEVAIARQPWGFAGVQGRFDTKQLQRGFQIYQQVCSNCHGLKRVDFRNLSETGGPEFSADRVKALAAAWPNKIPDGPNDAGKTFERAALPSDPILGPFKNDNEARAAMNGALPPDLSLIAKARAVEYTGSWYMQPFSMLRDIAAGYQEGGPDYIYGLLTGYDEAPAAVKMTDGLYYNHVFPGHQIAMPPPLAKDNFVKYEDGSGSLEQNARDVTAFLGWTADPTLDARKELGGRVLIYLLLTTLLLYIAKRRVWAGVAH